MWFKQSYKLAKSHRKSYELFNFNEVYDAFRPFSTR